MHPRMGHRPNNPELYGPIDRTVPTIEKVDFDVISLYLCVFWGMPLTLQHPDLGSIKF